MLVFTGLGPEKWQPRSGLGWQIDHFVGYFILTLIFCFAWARPLVVAGALVVFAVLLEASQALTTRAAPDVRADHRRRRPAGAVGPALNPGVSLWHRRNELPRIDAMPGAARARALTLARPAPNATRGSTDLPRGCRAPMRLVAALSNWRWRSQDQIPIRVACILQTSPRTPSSSCGGYTPFASHCSQQDLPGRPHPTPNRNLASRRPRFSIYPAWIATSTVCCRAAIAPCSFSDIDRIHFAIPKPPSGNLLIYREVHR